MLSRILISILSLSLLVPTCSPEDGTPPPEQTTELREKEAAAESVATAATPGTPQPLSEEEDSSRSARAEEPGPEVTGGALSNLHLTYAVIAIAAVVLVLLLK